jgi:hypothetical protein
LDCTDVIGVLAELPGGREGRFEIGGRGPRKINPDHSIDVKTRMTPHLNRPAILQRPGSQKPEPKGRG